MVCVVNIKSNEADGQDSSVHSFFYLLVYDIVTIYFWECRKIDKIAFQIFFEESSFKIFNKIIATSYNVEQAFWSLRNIIGWQVIAIYN